MMGGMSPETRRASFNIRNNKILIHCCILLDFLCELDWLYLHLNLSFEKKLHISVGAIKLNRRHGGIVTTKFMTPCRQRFWNFPTTDACHRAMLTREHRSLGQRRGLTAEGELFRELPVSWELLMIGWIKNSEIKASQICVDTSRLIRGAAKRR